MTHITLTDDQLSVVTKTQTPIAIHDQQGNLCGVFVLFIGSDEIAEAKQRLAANGPRYTTEQVLAKLRSIP